MTIDPDSFTGPARPMNWLLRPIGWLGGRSFAEMRQYGAAECGASLIAGGLAILSIAVICAGQYLFWSHLPPTAPHAIPIAAMLAAVFTGFYRALIRAAEVATRLGKAVCYGIGMMLVGINGLLAGHEVVLLPFGPQAQAQAAADAARQVAEYREAVETSLGLPALRDDKKAGDEAVEAAALERQSVPDAVKTLRAQAQACEARSAELQSRLPEDVDAPDYPVVLDTLAKTQRQCRDLRSKAASLLREHQAQADRKLANANAERDAAAKRLATASGKHRDDVEHTAPILQSSTKDGFGRHKALWSAVVHGLVPVWAVVGILFLAMALESGAFIVKMLLPPDEPALARQAKAVVARIDSAMRRETARVYLAGVHSSVAALRQELEDQAQHDVRTIVLPTLRLGIAARAFAQAHEEVERAHRSARRPSAELLRRLADIARAAQAAMGAPFGPGKRAGEAG